jgi:hypothetical protein
MVSARLERGLAILDEVLRAVGLRRHGSTVATLASVIWLRLRLRLRGLGYRLRAPSEIAPLELARIDACRSAGLGLLGFDLFAAFELHSRLLLLALDAGEPRRLGEAIAAEIALAATAGPAARGRVERLTAIAADLAARSGDPAAHARVALAHGVMAFYEGRWAEAEARLEGAERLLREQCVGVVTERGIVRLALFGARLFRGQIDLLRGSLAEALREAEELGELTMRIMYRTGYTVHVRLADGALDDARREAELAATLPPPSQRRFHLPQQLFARATLSLYAGEPVIAWRELRASWRELEATLALRQEWLRVLFWDLRGRVALAAAVASEGRARRQLLVEARRAARRLERTRAPWGRALALLLSAQAETLAGDRARAVALTDEAERALAAVDMALHAAVARLRLAALRGAEGAALGDGARAWLASARVRDPERYARLFAPVDPSRW